MSGTMIDATRFVRATPEQVWAVLTDLDGAARVLSGVTAIERVSGAGYAVGTRWRETRRMLGREATEEMWVTEVNAPHRTAVAARSGGTDYTTVFDLSPADGGTTLTMTFSAAAGTSVLHRLFAATLGRLAVSATKKVIVTDLQDIAAAAEGR